MVFTTRFFILFALGALPLVLLWSKPGRGWVMLVYDLALLAAAWWDYRQAESQDDLLVQRHLPRRLLIGTEGEVVISVSHHTTRQLAFTLKDEYPPTLDLRGERLLNVTPTSQRDSRGSPTRAAQVSYKLYASARGDHHFGDIVLRWPAPWGLVLKQARIAAAETVKVYPNIVQARECELQTQRRHYWLLGQRRARLRGQGKEFESLRDYVPGDELRHLDWAATARRGKLTTRQYRVECNQSVVLMLDAGRLMTARIERLAKLDHAINAALALGYAAVSGGDNIGLLVFNRQVTQYLPPKRGVRQLSELLEALYNVEPQMIEPSYARAFQYLTQHCRRRALVVILTDLIDREASAELLAYTGALLPRHLPLLVTIDDNDLRALVTQVPRNAQDVYQQSVAEELLQQREEALAHITQLGGLALDVPAGWLSVELVNKYLEVKERGLL